VRPHQLALQVFLQHNNQPLQSLQAAPQVGCIWVACTAAWRFCVQLPWVLITLLSVPNAIPPVTIACCLPPNVSIFVVVSGHIAKKGKYKNNQPWSCPGGSYRVAMQRFKYTVPQCFTVSKIIRLWWQVKQCWICQQGHSAVFWPCNQLSKVLLIHVTAKHLEDDCHLHFSLEEESKWWKNLHPLECCIDALCRLQHVQSISLNCLHCFLTWVGKVLAMHLESSIQSSVWFEGWQWVAWFELPWFDQVYCKTPDYKNQIHGTRSAVNTSQGVGTM